MNRAELLKSLLKTVHQGHSIPHDILTHVPTLTAKRQLDSILQLQMLIYNLAIEKHFPSDGGSIFILGELVSCVAVFVDMPQPAKKLASLDRKGFIEYCQNNRQFGQMTSKAMGIFPRLPVNEHLPRIMNYEGHAGNDEEGQKRYVGNPNWQLTRCILSEWQDCVKDSLTAEENLCCQILLSTDRLLEGCRRTSWNELWSRLYVWYMDKLLSSNVNPSIPFQNWHRICEEDKHVASIQEACYSSESTSSENIVRRLILAVIKEFIYFDKEDSHFKEAFEIFGSRQSTSEQLWQCLLINELFLKLAELLELEVVAEKSRDLMTAFKKQLEQDRIAEQFMYYLPQLFTRQELIVYLRKKQIAYWQYEFDNQVIETITLRQIQEGTLHPANAKQVLKLLTPEQFVRQVLSRDYSLWEGRIEKSLPEKKKLKLIVKTISQNAEDLATQLGRFLRLQKEEIVKGLKVFWQQWYVVQEVQENGVREQTLPAVLRLIKFDTKLPSKFKNQCLLPIEENELVWQMIDKLVDFTSANLELLPPSTAASIKETFYTKQFYQTLGRLPSSRRDKFWQRFSWILLKDMAFVKTLLAIKPNPAPDDPDRSVENQEAVEQASDIVTS